LLAVETFVSAFAASWIGACVSRAETGGDHPMLRILGSRPMVVLAGFSYSLYLVQHPIFRFTEKVINRLPLSFDANVGVHLLVVAPLIMGVAWVFSELFEKPFTTGGLLFRRRGRESSVAAPQLP
jgi:peptidoglycan/LPS O-acetylase OafA/YrhL